ncbi:MAG: PAS domain S-box protein [Rhodomicrobium sp.]|nr:PAS domain S-box protein [Rhodomicrobium sp.]
MIAKTEENSQLSSRQVEVSSSLKLQGAGAVSKNHQAHRKFDKKNIEYSNSSILHNFLSSAPDAIVTTTIDGIIKFYNNASQTLFHYRSQDVIGQRLTILFDRDFPAVPPFIAHPQSQQPQWRSLSSAVPVRGRKKNGELFPVELLMAQWLIDNQPAVIFYIKDLTSQDRQERRIAELEREIAHFSRHSMLGELATAITHELSQPLTAITNYTAAAGRSWTEATPEDIENRVTLIAKAGDQAKRAWLIMHRLRKLIQHNDAEFAQEDLRVSVKEALQLATIGAAERGIFVALDMPHDPVLVTMDRVQIQIVIANLIRNAVDELTLKDGERRIDVSLRVNDGMWAEVSVEDTGPGIAPEFFENIFDPFQTTKPQGLGMGLAVSRRIAIIHGGRLAAHNRPDGGAAFSFILPISISESVENE